MQNSNMIISAIYKARTTILEQLEAQGFVVDNYKSFSVAEINSRFANNQLDMIVEAKNENPATGKKRKAFVMFHLEKLVRPAVIQELIDDLYNIDSVLTNDDVLLIVSKDEVNETLVNYLKHIWETEHLFIIVQSIKRCQFNIQHHNLVPPHRILKEEEVEEIRKRYNITADTQFPDISRFDPVAQSIYMRPGEVCEITRASKTAITANYYRVCI